MLRAAASQICDSAGEPAGRVTAAAQGSTIEQILMLIGRHVFVSRLNLLLSQSAVHILFC